MKSAAPKTETATVERRKASVPIARDARRLASACGREPENGCLASTQAPFGAPSPHFQGNATKAVPAPFKQHGRRSVGCFSDQWMSGLKAHAARETTQCRPKHYRAPP